MKGIIKTNSPKDILYWLKNHSYANLPKELWDSKLWLYDNLVKIMSGSLTGDIDDISMYLVTDNNIVLGISLFIDKYKRLYFDAESYNAFYLIYNKLIKDNQEIGSIYFRRSNIANSFKREFENYKNSTAVNKFYIDHIPTIEENKELNIRELTVSDKYLFEKVILPDGSSLEFFRQNFNKYIEEGTRYFGAFQNNKLVSIAGLIMLTVFRSEIIGVGTYSIKDRRKGFASSVCKYAIENALKETPIVTWTADEHNIASNFTARKLGMKQYDSNYYFKF